MKKYNFLIVLVVLVLALSVGCNSKPSETNSETAESKSETTEPAVQETEEKQTEATEEKQETGEEKPESVEIQDAHGSVEVPVNPKKVVALDNRTFETLESWGIELLAVPKDVMPSDSAYVADESVQNIGNHREPDLELIAALDPELVIVGQRFAKHYETIKELVPQATVIDLTFDVSEEAASPGQNLIDGLINSNLSLGKIFDKEKEAQALVDEFNGKIEDAKAAYNGEDTVMALVVSAGEIGFSAPKSGRVWGPMYEVFGWKPSLEIDSASSDHKGDDISVEAIAESNPDWIMVLDRDAAVSSSDSSTPAKDVIENSPALANTSAVTEGKLIYAPNDTYTNESLQTYIELFDNIASAMGK